MRLPNLNKVVDTHGRHIRKLRVSLLDACNLRCFYCMPEDAEFMKSSRWLSAEEIIGICSALNRYGLSQIRVTGGEPTLRENFREIVGGLSNLKLQKLGLTTNGIHLERELSFLKETTCQHINVSLDSLNAGNFHRITRRDVFQRVYDATVHARQMGFKVKVNMVLMRGVNDHEVFDFLRFSAEHDIEVRFLEVMKIGEVRERQAELFIPADEIISMIKEKEDLTPVQVEVDSTSFSYKTSSGAQVGFIASESKPFCGRCSRWRLSADGFLRACLMSNAGVKIRGVPESEYPKLFESLFPMKPMDRIEAVQDNMYQIGG